MVVENRCKIAWYRYSSVLCFYALSSAYIIGILHGKYNNLCSESGD